MLGRGGTAVIQGGCSWPAAWEMHGGSTSARLGEGGRSEYEHSQDEDSAFFATPLDPPERDAKVPRTMTALVARAPLSGYSIQTVPVPSPTARGDVLLRVEACGVCASDAKMYSKATDFYWSPDNGRVLGGKPPDFRGVIPGHEFVGTVARAGPDARCARGEPLVPGDRVVVDPALACRERACRACEAGDLHKCARLRLYGQGIDGGFAPYALGLDGGFAPYALIHAAARLHRVPPNLPAHVAALCEPLSIAVHAKN
ncbi:chaperonin 10-like protein [Baffinella frigidus]|nr:chaperonin 10-like protein [Cryptophyta sp. CCMP2293]